MKKHYLMKEYLQRRTTILLLTMLGILPIGILTGANLIADQTGHHLTFISHLIAVATTTIMFSLSYREARKEQKTLRAINQRLRR